MIYNGEDGTEDLLGYKNNIDGMMEEMKYLFNHENREVKPLYDDIEEMIRAVTSYNNVFTTLIMFLMKEGD